MFNIPEKMPRSGIYALLNMQSGKFYIGGSIDLRKRIKDHLRDLNRKQHQNLGLQFDFHEPGSSFDVVVIEEVSSCDRAALKELVRTKERHYLQVLQPYHSDIGYNICHDSISSLGYRHTSESKGEIATATVRKNCTRLYRVENLETGEVFESVSNLAEFCRDRGMDHRGLWRVATGERKSYKDWICSFVGGEARHRSQELKDKLSKSSAKTYEITSPSGETQIVQGLRQFCEANGLDEKRMRCAAEGRSRSAYGWTVRMLSGKDKPSKDGAKFEVISPSGDRFRIQGLARFCRENNLSASCMARVSKGERSHYLGWKCRKLS